MGVATNVDGGRIHSCYWCDVCEEYMDKYLLTDCFQDALRFDDPEDWEEARKTVEGKG